MKSKNHLIKVFKGMEYIPKKGYTDRAFFTKKIERDNGVTFYPNMMHKIAKLTPSAYLLMHYLAGESSIHNNTFINNSIEREKFIKFLKKSCGLSYEDETVSSAYSELAKHHIFIKYGVRSVFTLNPVNIFKGSEAERKDQIQELSHRAIRTKGKVGIEMRRALGFPANLKASVMEY